MWSEIDKGKKGGMFVWERVCKPKNEGGLGVKELEMWNKAIVRKLIWEFIISKSSL